MTPQQSERVGVEPAHLDHATRHRRFGERRVDGLGKVLRIGPEAHHQFVHHLLQHGGVQLELGLEDAVDDQPGDACSAGDIIHRGAVESRLDEHRRCGAQDLRASLFAGQSRRTH